jgi:polysaccharide deacetylase family protein (PEP-CTERM system associated)
MKILAFDIEEWFHLLDNESTRTSVQWCKYEKRIHHNIDKILTFLEDGKNSATFFVLGWVAEKYPDVVKKIYDNGYEIGSHSYMHQLVYSQSPHEFREDLNRSIKLLQDITGEKVKYFRAPGFSITEKNLWSFEIIHELGIEIDCSIFPARRAHGGMPLYGHDKPSILKYNGISLRELPMNTYLVFSKQIVFSGGGYFRLLPYPLIKKWTEQSDYIMSYFHPRDFDPGQPRIKELSLLRKFKSYVGLTGAEHKLKKWLCDFNFVDIRMAEKLIDWDQVRSIRLPEM